MCLYSNVHICILDSNPPQGPCRRRRTPRRGRPPWTPPPFVPKQGIPTLIPHRGCRIFLFLSDFKQSTKLEDVSKRFQEYRCKVCLAPTYEKYVFDVTLPHSQKLRLKMVSNKPTTISNIEIPLWHHWTHPHRYFSQQRKINLLGGTFAEDGIVSVFMYRTLSAPSQKWGRPTSSSAKDPKPTGCARPWPRPRLCVDNFFSLFCNFLDYLIKNGRMKALRFDFFYQEHLIFVLFFFFFFKSDCQSLP